MRFNHSSFKGIIVNALCEECEECDYLFVFSGRDVDAEMSAQFAGQQLSLCWHCADMESDDLDGYDLDDCRLDRGVQNTHPTHCGCEDSPCCIHGGEIW